MRLPDNRKKAAGRGRSSILGVGLDNKDGHARVTKGENFHIVGGSEETHERLTETVIKVNEKLDAKGKTLEQVSKEEFYDILHESME